MMRLFPKSICYVPVVVCGVLTACASVSNRGESSLTSTSRLQVAQAADEAGNNDLAISMYTAAAAKEPSNIELQLRCADALVRSGKMAQARQLLSERLSANADNPDLIRALALVDLVAGKPAQAIVQLDRVLASNQGDVRALVDKAVALDLLRQHTAAQTIYRQVLATTPDDADTRNDLAVSLMMEGRTRQALDTLRPVQNNDNSSPRLKANLGILYAATGDTERSRQLLGDRISDGDVSVLTQALAGKVNSMPAEEQ